MIAIFHTAVGDANELFAGVKAESFKAKIHHIPHSEFPVGWQE
jgi:hypothetical protein